MNKKLARRLATKLAFYFGFPALIVSAANVYWNGSEDTSFNTPDNWSADPDQTTPSGAVPGVSDIAIFNTSGLVDFQVGALGANQSVAGLIFNANATGPITIAGPNTLTLGSSGITLQAGTGAHTIAAPIVVGVDQTWTNLSTNAFTHSGDLRLVGNLVLTGTGAFTFDTGTVTGGAANRMITVSTTGPVHFGAVSTTDSGVARLIIFNVENGAVVDVDGAITGNGAVRKDGAGTLNFNAANSFTSVQSGLTITDGRLNVNVSNTTSPRLNLGGVAGGSPVLNLASGVNYKVENIIYDETQNPNGAVISGDGSLSLDGNRTFDVGDSTNADVDLRIDVAVRNQAGGGGTARALTKTGGGTLVFNGVNDFTGTFTINSGRVIQNASQTAAGALTFGGVSNLTIGSGVRFLLAGTVTVSTAASGALIDGPGDLLLFASTTGTRVFSVSDGAADNDLTVESGIVTGTGTQGIQKIGLGRMVMRGVNDYTGATEVDRSELVLDYSQHNGDNKLSNTAELQLRGGTVTLNGHATAATTEEIGSLRLFAGTNVVSLVSNGGQAVTLKLNDINRGIGEGLVDFRTKDSTLETFLTTEANNEFGIIGGYATFNGERFAANDGSGRLVAAAGVEQNDVAQWKAGDHIIVTGPLTGILGTNRIHSLIFDAPVANTLVLNNQPGALTLEAGAILVSDNVGANNTTISGGQIIVPGQGAGAPALAITNYSQGTLEIAANLGGTLTPLSSTEEITLGGTGEILLSGRNFHNGDTNVQGNVRVTGGNAVSDFRNVVLATGGSGVVFNLDGSTEGIGTLSGGGTSSTTDAHVELGAGGTLIINGAVSGTYSGGMTGSGTLIKRGSGRFTSTAQSLQFDGTLQVLGGLMEFDGSNNSGLLNGTEILVRGGELLGEQNQSGSLDKFGSGQLTLEGTAGAGVRLTSSQTTTATTGSRTESMSRLNLNAGSNTISVFNQGGTSATVTILAFNDAASAFVRGHRATLLVQGDNLGETLGKDSSRVTFASAIGDLQIGGGGAAGTTSISVLPFVIGQDSNAASVGNSFVTVGPNGLRPLDLATEYQTSYAAATASGNENFSTAVSQSGLGAAVLNSLRIDTGGGAVTLSGSGGAGNTLTLASGALLVTAGSSANGAVIDGFDRILAGSNTAGDDELVIFVTSSNGAAANASLMIGSAIADQATGGGATSLTKSGAGTLVLTGTNSYSGETTINEGALEFGALSNLGTGSMVRLSGGTLRWTDGNTADLSSRTIELLGSSVFLTTAGSGHILNAGSVLDIGANNVTFATAIGNGGVGGLTKTGSGTLTLLAAPTYTGTTVVNEGALNFQTIAANTTSALYILSNSGEVTSTVENGLNLGSLVVGGVFSGTTSGTGILTVNGGAVNIGTGKGDEFVLLGWRDLAAGTTPSSPVHLLGRADFQNATGVTIDVAQITLGSFQSNVGGNQSTASGELLLSTAASAVNTITANSIIIGNAPGGVFNNTHPSTFNLGGGTTTMNTDTLVIGGRKSAGFLIIDAGGTLILRGTQGGDTAANVFIGDNDNAQSSTGTPASGTLDLTGATADLRIDYLNIGRLSFSSAAGSGSGTLTFDTGTVQATTVRLADANFNPGSNPNIGNSAATSGTINQSGGVFRFEEMSKGAGTASYFWNAGTIQNIAHRDLVNQNVVINMDTSDERKFVVDAGQRATMGVTASFTGGGGFTKAGAGTLVLAGANDYTGDTFVDEGRLLVNGSLSGSVVMVNDGGTLGGTGSIAAPVTIGSGGTIAPGEGIGVLNTGDFSLEIGSTLQLELGGTSPGNTDANHDQLVVTGSVSLFGDAEVRLSLAGGYNPTVGDVFYVILNDGTLGASVGGFANASGGILNGTDGSQFLVSYNAEAGVGFQNVGNDVALQLLVVPEPSSWCSLLAGAAVAFGVRRLRRAGSRVRG